MSKSNKTMLLYAVEKIFICILTVAFLWFAWPYMRVNPFAFLLGGIVAVTLCFRLLKKIPVKFRRSLPAPKPAGSDDYWWSPILLHPAQSLFWTFAFLIFSGTFFLNLPFSAVDKISFLDAAFTSVSSVCVTGLTVIDVGTELTFGGQLVLLFLMQFGGLGLMTVATVALHAVGRISLKKESLMQNISGTPGNDIFSGLNLVLKYTAVCEILGATILAFAFHHYGDEALAAAWKGIFTSVAAFCNAGFFLSADSLSGYAGSPLILFTVASLIMAGGIPPIAVLAVPDLMRGKHVRLDIKIMLEVTAALAFGGCLFILLFEWDGVLQNFGFIDKVSNAWFQSITLRTAGFNSVPIDKLAPSTILLMIILMLMGGCPGGTAGGVKTTAVGVIAAAFLSTVRGSEYVQAHKKRIDSNTVIKAVVIVVAFAFVVSSSVFMLVTTQKLPVIDIIFEAVSAIATVGLTTGITGSLDEIGQIIIMMTMFIGRIGPLTFFLLLDSHSKFSGKELPPEDIMLG